ncbi:hypothetical protein [Sphingopyxis sp.]|jgi:hypothetical protein|uniref:hypothetical protein n=1 Tax=Sphingopyxis sp. TaxID=1908224 RepID=UPI002DF5D110|nr:hypothetical protein [Sphingopyxis sp.]
MRLKIFTLTGAAALALAACTTKEEPTQDDGTSAPTGGVVREEAKAEPETPPVTPMPAATVIQSQPGPDGSQVDLLSVKVTGDILTVTLRCSSAERYNRESIRVAQVSVIDDATSQRIGVLKDNEGNALVSNLNRSGSPDNDNMMVDCTAKPGVMWAKFPAPPATSPTVSINLPGVAPFDGIAVQR